MNNITVSGNLGHAAELKAAPDGTPFLSFSIADNQGKGKDGTPLPAQWFYCTLWGKRAEWLAPYMPNGTPVTIIGRLSLRQYQGQDGMPRAALDVRVYDIALQGRAYNAAQNAAPAPAPASALSYADVKGRRAPPTQQSPAQGQQRQAWQAWQAAAPAPGMAGFTNDDIPF